jgi:hypothetical protein
MTYNKLYDNPIKIPFIAMVVVIMMMGLLLFSPAFRGLLLTTTERMPQDSHIIAEYLWALIWALILGASIIIWPVSNSDKVGLLWVWLAKCLVTLGFMLFYESHYYEFLDALSYYNVSVESNLATATVASKGVLGTSSIVIISWFHNRVLPDSYHLLKVSFSMVGFIGVYILYRSYIKFIQRENIRALYILALFPSVLFWSSILGKEPIILLGISLFIYGVIGWHRSLRYSYLLTILLGVVVTTVIRSWMGFILVAPLFVFAFPSQVVSKRVIFILFSIVLLIAPILFVLNTFHVKSIKDLAVSIEVVFDNLRVAGGTGVENKNIASALSPVNVQIDNASTPSPVNVQIDNASTPSPVNVQIDSIGKKILFLPKGILSALFKPLPGEVRNSFGLLAGIENVVLLILFAVAILRLRLTKLKNTMVLWSIIFILIWACFYGFVSYHNFGTAVRYRLQVLPVMLGLFFYLAIGASRPPTSESLQKEKV